MRLPAVVTNDGFLDPETMGDVRINPGYDAPSLSGHMVIGLRSDVETALAKNLDDRGELDVIGKSGHSRVMMSIDRRTDEEVVFDSNHRVIVPVTLSSLRAVEVRRNGVRDELLSVLADMVRERRREIAVGRLALASPEDALPQAEVLDALAKDRLLLPEDADPEECIAEDGRIELPLEQLQYLFCEPNFDEDAMRRVLRFGKHGLDGMQDMVRGLPRELRGRQAFVGGIRMSIGPYVAIIERQTNRPEVEHLAARVLDGVRTTGIDHVRQVELFNKSTDAVPTEELAVRLRLFHATREVQEFASRVVDKKTIARGVSFPDVIELDTHPELLMQLLAHTAPKRAGGKPYGCLVGANKYHEISWMDLPSFQGTHLASVNAKFAASDPKYCVFGKDIPYFARGIASVLRYVGREQTEGRLCASWGFPHPSVMARMRDEGTGVFVAHDLRAKTDAFDKREGGKPIPAEAEASPVNDVYFDEQLYHDFRRLSKEGVSFYLVRHPSQDAFNEGEPTQAEVFEWHRRGLWVRPRERERLERIDTVIAMYGTHVAGSTEDMLYRQITQFSLRMKRRFGSALAYIHGKGPGVMYIADNVAQNLPTLAQEHGEFAGEISEDIFRIGVGIDAERFGQAPNFHPPAQADFQAKDRLTRQKLMNDIATINVFNVGGAGTLEEIAITLCSQKLLKNIPAPLIFVDPIGLGKDSRHLWQTLQELIADLAATKKAGTGDTAKDMQLLQRYVPQFIHVVSSYEEAASIIERFADDPAGYYLSTGIPKDQVIHAIVESGNTFRETGFPMPSWIDTQAILDDPRWPEENDVPERSARSCGSSHSV